MVFQSSSKEEWAALTPHAAILLGYWLPEGVRKRA